MTIDEIKRVCVVGGGLMGRQIALNTALYGYEVTLTDSYPQVLAQADAWAGEYLAGRLTKGKLTQEQADAARSRLRAVTDLAEAAREADLVIEAIVEQKAEKVRLFTELDGLVRPDTIIGSNSSYMPSSMFAGCVSHPERLANLHYFNPALAMKLVEVVKGPHTGNDTSELLMEFARRTGKRPVLLEHEIEGFIVNRVNRNITVTALELVALGIATPEDVDIALENGLNHPMGPFRLMDLIGIDLTYFVLEDLVKTGRPCPGFELVREKYDQGAWGRKTGRGWYDYTGQNARVGKGEG